MRRSSARPAPARSRSSRAGAAPARDATAAAARAAACRTAGTPFAGDARASRRSARTATASATARSSASGSTAPAIVETQVVATDEVRRPAKIVWRRSRSALRPGPTSSWRPKRSIAARTYLARFVVRGLHGGKRVYGYEAAAARPPDERARRPGSRGSRRRCRSGAIRRGVRRPVSISTDERRRSACRCSRTRRQRRTRDCEHERRSRSRPRFASGWSQNRNAPHLVEVGR